MTRISQQKTADTAILRLFTQLKWIEEVLAFKDFRQGAADTFADQVFEAEINKAIVETDVHYNRTYFREALQTGFYALQTARDDYRLNVGSMAAMNRGLLLRFIEVQILLLAPITPHFSDYVWRKLLGKTESVRVTSWPAATAVNTRILKQNDYLFRTIREFRLRKEALLKPKKAKKGEAPEPTPAPPTTATIIVAKSYPEWKTKTMDIIRPFFPKADDKTAALPEEKDLVKPLSVDAELKKQMKKIMPYVASVKQEFKEQGAAALELKLDFDEKEFLASNSQFLTRSLELQSIEVKLADDDESGKDRCSPGQPFVIYS